MLRPIIFAAIAAAFAITGTPALAGNGIDGTYAGRSIAAPNASATCNPFVGSTKPSDYFCRFNVHGAYYDDTVLGDGTYSGTLTVNWNASAGGNNPNYNNEQCQQVTGTIIYKRSGKSGALTVALVPNPAPFNPTTGLDSMLCIYQANGTTDFHYLEDVTSVTGYFKTVVKHPSSSSIDVNGYSNPSGPIAANSLDSAFIGANLS
jgi:hypothetical protein